MNTPSNSPKSRREFLKASALVGGGALAAASVLRGYAAEEPEPKAAEDFHKERVVTEPLSCPRMKAIFRCPRE